MNNKRLSIEWSLLLLAALAFVMLGLERGFGERLDQRALDFGMEAIAGSAPDDIVLVTIDDRSLADIGTWPWDREIFAQLVDAVATAEPEIVVFDILLIEPSTAESDKALEQALAEAGKVTLPHTFAPKPGAIDEVVPVMPLAAFSAVAAGIGHVAVFPDSDGIVRRFSSHYRADGEDYPHLALVTERLRGEVGPRGIFTHRDVPIFPVEPSGSFRTISASDMLNGTVPPEFLRGQRVLIGATAQGLGDRYSVPDYAGRIMSGVEIQANMMAAISEGRIVKPVPLALNTLILALSVIALMLVFWKATPRTSLLFAFGLLAVLLLVAILSVWLGQMWLRIAPALAAIVIAYPLWGWRRLAMVSRFLEAEARTLEQSAPGKTSVEGYGFDAVARQVSQVKRLTDEVKQSLSFIRGVIDAAPDPMLVFDKQRQVALMNDKAMELFAHWSIEDQPHFAELVAGVRARYDPESQEMILQDGRAFLVANAPLDADIGSEVMILREVTELRNAERQRQEMLEFLSHDMRSPQVAIIGLTGKSSEELVKEERLARIEGQARRTLSLAENFVQIARLGYDGITREDCDIGALLYEAADRAFPAAKRKGVSIETRIPDDPEFCLVDPYAISRVVDNLLDNAIKHTPSGRRITLALDPIDDESITIVVSDQGEGFPEDRLEQPFERFGAQSGDAGLSVGLGLAYVKRAVDEHGGTISLKSSREEGSEIAIRLLRG
ncbi:CHASE2 and HATPase_c domain-containing protein [Altererythrobacter arenosus]|uniref:histidine kinase n=1 Tax=Altererythrobacter arenosus TaxID=3032592 RepID=A0ABY8FPY0_9SPHN|nr:CHASE2 and HATPase_c domain-containing protein [Altererythrobacter sp. CAU 1644]WFL77068.1 CHASE2 and HATPase_c domain-containing protein [Altererythrobacter sp. CAU 1644]